VPRRGQGRVDADKPLAPMAWVQRLKRVFAIDIETCPHFGGTLRLVAPAHPCARVIIASLHVIAWIEEPALIARILGHVQQRLERLCRYITRPPIATKRLSVDGRGRVVYQYKQPFRDGSTNVVLEPVSCSEF